MADRQITCRQCAVQFTVSKGWKIGRFCTTRCSEAFYRAKAGKPKRWEDGIPACHKEATCFWCEIAFKPKRAGRTKFCSRDCAFEFKTAKAALPAPPVARVFMGKCEQCASRFRADNPASLCSEECKKERARQAWAKAAVENYVPKQIICQECGQTHTTTYGNKSRVYCGIKCLRRATRRVSKNARDARERAAFVERVNPMKVFERDGWRCHLCGCKTPRRLRGTYDDRAPELEHIVPLSKGGEHSYRNTACSCRKCNQEESDQAIGQMLLFG